MCGGDFMSKSPDEALEFLNYVAEISKSWDEPHERDLHKSKSQSNSNGGMYMLNENVDLQAKMIALTRRLEELKAKLWGKDLLRIIRTSHGIVDKNNFLQANTHKANNPWKTFHNKFLWLC
uniref:Uncharacterized protein n=1 Tax=Vitis vinifera TaxID=29760 RepID=A5C781_VITVI|nr:hypothetical protein VITISV_028240 [Vitis vinifera]